MSARDNYTDHQFKMRDKAAKMAADTLKFKWLKSPNFKDNCLDTISLLKVVKSIEKIKEKLNPILSIHIVKLIILIIELSTRLH